VTAMPDRGYLVDHPIAGRDHWLAHPFELILAAWSIVFGTLLAISAFVPVLDEMLDAFKGRIVRRRQKTCERGRGK